jgi:hypothetical protein
MYALNGIRTHDPTDRASEDSSCLRPRGRPLRSATVGYNLVRFVVSYDVDAMMLSGILVLVPGRWTTVSHLPGTRTTRIIWNVITETEDVRTCTGPKWLRMRFTVGICEHNTEIPSPQYLQSYTIRRVLTATCFGFSFTTSPIYSSSYIHILLRSASPPSIGTRAVFIFGFYVLYNVSVYKVN